MIDGQRSTTATTSRASRTYGSTPAALEMLQDHVRERRTGGARKATTSRWATIATIRSTAAIWGFVPRENIMGKPLLIFWSYDATTEQFNNRTYWFDAALHFFSRTRWDHTMRPVRGYDLR